MKKFLTFLLFFAAYKLFGQEVIKVAKPDSCIITDCTLNKTELVHMNRLCPKDLVEVKSFYISYKDGDVQKEIYVNGKTWDKKIFKTLRSGQKIYFEDIKGISPEGRFIKIANMTVTIK